MPRNVSKNSINDKAQFSKKRIPQGVKGYMLTNRLASTSSILTTVKLLISNKQESVAFIQNTESAD